MSTLKDVAAASGLSVTTVAVVLAGKADDYGIAAATRARVHQAAARLGYQHNAHARALSTGRSNLVGILGMCFETPIRLEVVHKIAQALVAHGYHVAVQDFAWHGGNPIAALADLQSRRVEGLIVAALMSREEREILGRLAAGGTPIVALDDIGIPGADVVTTDRAEGYFLATRHLLGLGHRRIALIVPPDVPNVNLRARLQGYRRGYAEAGLPVDERLILPPAATDSAISSGLEIVPRLLACPARPTAVLFQNDRMALAAVRGLHEAGKRVPADLAVVGFDGVAEAELCHVPLTTLAQPVDELAATAVSLLVEQTGAPERQGASRRVLIPPRLIIRRSCGAAAASR